MNKRILAFICMLALLVGLLPVGAIAQTEKSTPNTYMVGYAKKDINPWKDPDDHDKGIINGVYLTGNNNDASRECEGVRGEGLFTTCTSVTDDNGTTVLFITLDTLQAENIVVSEMRNGIMQSLQNKFGKSVVNGNQIFISASHTHSAPSLTTVRGHKVLKENKCKNDKNVYYYDYILAQVADAAVEAYENKAYAKMKRGSIDATEVFGYQMNFLRHYTMTATNGVSYVSGTNFSYGGIEIGSNSAAPGYKVSDAKHIAVADDTMHLLQFEFEGDTNPIVLVNWRAHPTMDSGAHLTEASSDYVGFLRTNLEEKYRVAFFQGASANTIINSRYFSGENPGWTAAGTEDTETYGKLLAEIAETCLNDSDKMQALPCGDIRIVQKTFKGNIQCVEQQWYEAAVAAQKAQPTAGYPYEYTVDGEEVFTVNSGVHAAQLISRYTKGTDDKDFTTQEIAVVSLGDSAVFVTAPNELSDRYGIESYEDNDGELWATLVGETYGTPFVLTHTNGSMGYLPNTLNYDYNDDIQDKVRLGIGSYEANTSHYEKGTGEQLIAEYAKILKSNKTGIITKLCEACGKEFDWIPVSFLQYTDNYLGGGHYYLTEDIPSNIAKTVRSGETLCLDLNGHSIKTNGRSFSVNADGELNVFDSAGEGSVTSTESGANYVHGTLNIAGEMNIYGGSFAFNHNDFATLPIARGGVATVSGTLNMYGGKILGTTLTKLNDETKVKNDDGVGAAIYVSGGEVHLEKNAKVTSGEVPNDGFGPCIALANNNNCSVSLSGNASVDDIYFRQKNSSNLTISDTYEGTVGLSYASDIELNEGTVIGSVAVDADIKGATFNLPKSHNGQVLTDWLVYSDGSNLKIKEGYDETTVALVGGTEYDSLQNAVYECNGSIIQLIKNVATATTVDKNVYLDLNGYNVTGTVTVNTNVTLYCMDSQTDDYTVADEKGELTGYGKLTNVSGTVKGIPVDPDSDQDGYLMINEGTDEAPKYSFHKVDLGLDYITLSPGTTPGMSYKGNFKGDEMVEEAVESYGVALSVMEMPDEGNLKTACGYSEFSGFNSGSAGNTKSSTKLTGVMKPTNATLINYRNANMKIYGRAYIKTAENEYMFGEGQTHTLKAVTEKMDENWEKLNLSDTQENALKEMYKAHESVMKHWNLPNLEIARELD